MMMCQPNPQRAAGTRQQHKHMFSPFLLRILCFYCMWLWLFSNLWSIQRALQLVALHSPIHTHIHAATAGTVRVRRLAPAAFWLPANLLLYLLSDCRLVVRIDFEQEETSQVKSVVHSQPFTGLHRTAPPHPEKHPHKEKALRERGNLEEGPQKRVSNRRLLLLSMGPPLLRERESTPGVAAVSL